MTTPVGRSPYWWRRVACSEVGLDLFYADETSPSRAYVKHAKKVCALCPVLVECLDDAYDQESDLPRHRIFGVRAGMAPWERHDLYQSVSGV